MPQCSPPLVHPVVHQGVHTAVCHGQPVEGQVHVRRVPEQNKKLLFLFKKSCFSLKDISCAVFRRKEYIITFDYQQIRLQENLFSRNMS